MSNRTIQVDDQLYDYLKRVSVREADHLAALRKETAARDDANMQMSPEQGQFLRLLVQMIGAKRAIEIGVYTGYSSICIAEGLPDDGKLIAIDPDPEVTSVAQSYWNKAGIAGKVELRSAGGIEVLDQLLEQEAGTFDFAFVDAEKTEYLDYFERLLKLLRLGGVIAVDNVLWDGAVADPSNQEESTIAIREFNDVVARDSRVDLSLIPIADGVTLLRKRA